MSCPCENCPCIAICRLKSFPDMTCDCKLVLNTLYYDKTTEDGARSKVFCPKLVEIYTVLRPIKWQVEESDRGESRVVSPGNGCVVWIRRVESQR